MSTRQRTIAVLIGVALVCVALIAGVWRVAADLGVREAARVADERARLYAASLGAALERFEHLPYVLARDPILLEAAATGETDALNRRLEGFAERAGADALYLMDATALTTAASNWRDDGGFIGRRYDFRPYFQTAVAGGRGAFFAIGATTGEPGWFLAERVMSGDGALLGVVAVKVDLRPLERAWRDGGELVMVADAHGVIALSSREEWRYRTLAPLSQEIDDEIRETLQYADENLDQLDDQPIAPLTDARADPTTEIGDVAYIRAEAMIAGREMRVIYLSKRDAAIAGANRAATLTAAILLGIAALVGALLYRRIRARLARSERRTEELSVVNAQLEAEIVQRRAAEERLRAAQSELEKRSKLAALGELATAVNHELSQPLAAMKTYIAAEKRRAGAVARPQSATGFDLEALVDRMIGITRQMKVFTRKPQEPPPIAGLADAVTCAIRTMRPLIDEAAITLETRLAEAPLFAPIDPPRLEQVLVNLIGNAIDALREKTRRRLSIDLGLAESGQARIRVADSGPGLPDGAVERVFDPFFTTKASGEGLGLGLALSAKIVEEAGGRISAHKGDDGGAAFVIDLPRAAYGEQAATTGMTAQTPHS